MRTQATDNEIAAALRNAGETRAITVDRYLADTTIVMLGSSAQIVVKAEGEDTVAEYADLGPSSQTNIRTARSADMLAAIVAAYRGHGPRAKEATAVVAAIFSTASTVAPARAMTADLLRSIVAHAATLAADRALTSLPFEVETAGWLAWLELSEETQAEICSQVIEGRDTPS